MKIIFIKSENCIRDGYTFIKKGEKANYFMYNLIDKDKDKNIYPRKVKALGLFVGAEWKIDVTTKNKSQQFNKNKGCRIFVALQNSRRENILTTVHELLHWVIYLLYKRLKVNRKITSKLHDIIDKRLK